MMNQVHRWIVGWIIWFVLHRICNWISDHAIEIVIVISTTAILMTALISLEPEGTVNESPTEASGYTRHAG